MMNKISVVVAFEVETVDTKNDIQKIRDSVFISEEAEDGMWDAHEAIVSMEDFAQLQKG